MASLRKAAPTAHDGLDVDSDDWEGKNVKPKKALGEVFTAGEVDSVRFSLSITSKQGRAE